ncbi:MAG: DUF6599 family protein [Terracidiphilus sp.]
MKHAALLFPFVLAAGAAGAQDFFNCHFVPGWEQSGTKRQYDATNLFDYKDGGAEGYLIFGFVRMSSTDCKSGANTVTIDVSEMTGSDEAYGIFAANLDPTRPTTQIGMGGQVDAQSALFAKGKYYVEIVETAADSSADDSATMRAFCSGIEMRLEGAVTPPAQLRWFPPGNVAPIRMVPESVLGLRELKRGYVTNYTKGQAFVVLEETPDAAALALKALRARFPGAAPVQVGDDAFQANAQYLGGLCIFRKGRVIAGFVNLATPQEAAAQAAALAAHIP